LPLTKHAIADKATAAASGEAANGAAVKDAGWALRAVREAPTTLTPEERAEEIRKAELFHWDSPGLWAIIAILILGAVNLLGPKHSGGFAIVAAIGMIIITLLVLGGAFIFSGKMHCMSCHSASAT